MYQVLQEEGVFHILSDGAPVFTPAGNAVRTEHKALAEKLARHLETHGADPDNRYSIALYHYPMLDFVLKYPRSRTEKVLILGFDPLNDWTLRETDIPKLHAQRWNEVFGDVRTRVDEGRAWISGLNSYQLCAAMVLGRIAESVNIPYLVAHCQSPKESNALARQIVLLRHSLGKEPLHDLFANFRFYWSL